MPGLVVGDADIHRDLAALELRGGRHRHRVLQQLLVVRARHAMVVDLVAAALHAAAFREDDVVVVHRRHVAILAGLARLRIAVRAIEPFAVGIVDQHAARHVPGPDDAAEDAVVARRAIGAFVEQRQFGVAPGDVVEGAEEELLPFCGPVEAIAQDAGHIGQRQLGLRIEIHVADLMAEIARDPFGRVAGEAASGWGRAEQSLSTARP